LAAELRSIVQIALGENAERDITWFGTASSSSASDPPGAVPGSFIKRASGTILREEVLRVTKLFPKIIDIHMEW